MTFDIYHYTSSLTTFVNKRLKMHDKSTYECNTPFVQNLTANWRFDVVSQTIKKLKFAKPQNFE